MREEADRYVKMVTLTVLKGGGLDNMGNYSCRCPAPGCKVVFTAKADSLEEAYKKVYPSGNQHLYDKHPDFPEDGDREERGWKYFKENVKKS